MSKRPGRVTEGEERERPHTHLRRAGARDRERERKRERERRERRERGPTHTYEEQHVEASRARDGGVERPQAVGGHEEQAALLPPQIVQLS